MQWLTVLCDTDQLVTCQPLQKWKNLGRAHSEILCKNRSSVLYGYYMLAYIPDKQCLVENLT